MSETKKSKISERQVVGYAVDKITGEANELYDGYSVVYKPTIDEDMIYHYKKDAKFVKLYVENLDVICENCTKSELVFMIKMIKYICHEDNFLRFGGDRRGRLLSIKDLSELMNMDYRNAWKVINSLCKKGLVAQIVTGSIDNKKVQTKAIIYNPNIATNGSRISKYVDDIFRDTLVCPEEKEWVEVEDTTNEKVD